MKITLTDYFDISAGLIMSRYPALFKAPPKPRVIAYTVTWRCNAACDMCGIKDIDKELKKSSFELTASDIERAFKDPLLRRLDLIRFTGGEPFIKEDFGEIVTAIAKNTRTKIYYITTNGYYTGRIGDLVRHFPEKAGDLVIQVSLDAARDIHDKIRRLPGLYDKAIGTLRLLKDLKGSHKFAFGVNQMVSAETAPYIDEISSLCRELGCDHKLYIGQETHESDILKRDKHDRGSVLLSNPSKEVVRALYDKVERYNGIAGRGDHRLSPENLWRIIENKVIRGAKNRALYNLNSPNPGCLACFFYLRLLPDGTVMPCTLRAEPFGNIKRSAFGEIWNSAEAKKIRREVRGCQGCWVECDIVPNIVYSFSTIYDFIRG